jgi:von Willebrand factor type A domain/Aerotolerance regulator N-terminal
MSFQQPFMLWTLLSLIPLAAIYFLRVRPRQRPTTALFLWEQVLRQKRRSALWQRLRDLFSLLLMALAFSAVTFALARPQWGEANRADLLLLIDNSLSMSSQEGSRTRLELAKEAARDIIAALDGNQRAAVASISHEVEMISHLSDSPRDLYEAIDTIRPSVAELSRTQLRYAAPNIATERKRRVLLFSDGCFEPADLPANVELVKVGTSRNNVGIIAADARALPGATQRMGLFFQLYSSINDPIDLDVKVVHRDGEAMQSYKVLPLRLVRGMNPPQVVTIEHAPFGEWLVQVDYTDALEHDNTASLYLSAPDPIPVAVESRDQFFLENSVRAFADQTGQLTLVPPGTSSQHRSPIVVNIGATSNASRVILFRPEGESLFWKELGEPVEVLPRVVERGHPVIRYIDAESLTFAGARQLAAPEGAQVWVVGDNGVPLLYQVRHGAQTAIVINLDPAQADFYFSAWFPVVVHSAATYLAGREETMRASVKPHDEVMLSQHWSASTMTVVRPDGETETGSRFLRPDQLGFYRVTADGQSVTVGCSALSRRESNIENDAVQGSTESSQSSGSPASWLTWLAIVVVTVESVLYHRRKVG